MIPLEAFRVRGRCSLVVFVCFSCTETISQGRRRESQQDIPRSQFSASPTHKGHGHTEQRPLCLPHPLCPGSPGKRAECQSRLSRPGGSGSSRFLPSGNPDTGECWKEAPPGVNGHPSRSQAGLRRAAIRRPLPPPHPFGKISISGLRHLGRSSQPSHQCPGSLTQSHTP